MNIPKPSKGKAGRREAAFAVWFATAFPKWNPNTPGALALFNIIADSFAGGYRVRAAIMHEALSEASKN